MLRRDRTADANRIKARNVGKTTEKYKWHLEDLHETIT